MVYRILFIFLALGIKTAFALDLELTQGINAALPIAVAHFEGEQSSYSISDVIQHDLQMSGQFRLIAAPMSNGSAGASAIQLWRQAGADSVVLGRMLPLGGGRYEVRFSLYDAASNGRLLLSKSYTISAPETRALAHHISDEIYQQLTGERGIFSTRISYVVVERRGENARYTLDVADVDGYNPRVLLESSEPIMSPTWSPDARQIAYVSFEHKRAQIYAVSVETGKRRLLTSFSGINGAPSWSPDGQHLAVVLSKSGNPKIYSIDMGSGHMTQLTFGDTIDTEPRYSPDGRYLLFTSGRGGTPQIYRLSLANGQITRLTYEGNYNARASYTPNQKMLVMLHREDKQFSIGVQDLNRGDVMSVTSSPFDESPSVSPNGRLIVYATHAHDKGILAMVSIDGRIKWRLPESNGDVQEPAWSPYLG